ncbi:DUF3530 family protein [Marinobacterium marinum]|uniref:DUF3530 family protein n=1 Tax=Marinobacterium marinum TaxID=2756129 RepID=A0A7W1WZK7_9GAMM|nr:DUF3530 family protein [Marinobacterium marinum]MBA4503140.1 DUF3530 family protein [Marinobacterium marinum]
MLKFAPFILCALSSPCLATEPVRQSTSSGNPEQQLLQQLDSSHELLTLESDDDRFILLYRPAMMPEPHGALLILPDPGAAGGWLGQTRALTRYLPEHGWSVLTLEPLPLPSEALPPRTRTIQTALSSTAEVETLPSEERLETSSVTAPPPEEKSAPPSVTHSEQLRQRLTLAWQELAQRSEAQQQIILAIGQSATSAATLALEKGEEVTLVLIDPQPLQQSPTALANLFAPLSRHTILDLYHAPLPGYPEAEPNAGQRRLQAARMGLNAYHQGRVPGVFRGWQAEMPWLVKQVRGMLERILLQSTAEEALTSTPDTIPPLTQMPPGQRLE